MNSDLILVLESASWPALLVDGRGDVLHANGVAVRTFGAALDGEPRSLSKVWSPENGSPVDQFLVQWEKSPSAAISLKYRVPGDRINSFLTAICDCSEAGEKNYILQLLPDTAYANGNKSEAADINAAQKQKLDCALQLARSVALDFNNALTSILGYTSLLLSKAEKTHPWRRPLLEVEKAAAKAAEIANDLAAFSRQEKEVRTQQSGNLNTILQRCAESFQNAQKDRATWKLHLERRLFAAKFDEAKIQQAFLKIIENSIESFKAEGNITIQTRNVQLAEPTQDLNARLSPGSYVCTEITDNGAGIEEAVLPRIFEPFFTTKKGTHRGLGLAWVYGIVTNHGGGVAVSSTPGAGTSVRVYLPAEKSLIRDSGGMSGDLTGSQTILMVDDEDLLLTMGETILSGYGYKVLTANTGQKALEIASNEQLHIDLLITDLVMPQMSGRELVEHFRKLSPATRIMSSSGYAWPSNQRDSAAYLQKPFTSQELLTKVKQMLAEDPAPVD